MVDIGRIYCGEIGDGDGDGDGDDEKICRRYWQDIWKGWKTGEMCDVVAKCGKISENKLGR